MDYITILSFLTASLLLTIAPGPDNLFVLAESITKGSKHGIAISIGLVSGILVHTTLIIIGVAVILQDNPYIYNLVKILGAMYLFYLAYSAIYESMPSIKLEGEKEQDFSWFHLIRKGWLMNVLNPKVSLFFISFLPQFITEGNLSNSIQIGLLGLLFMAQAIIVFVLISILSGFFSNIFQSPKAWKKMKWSKVIILFLIGVFILFE